MYVFWSNPRIAWYVPVSVHLNIVLWLFYQFVFLLCLNFFPTYRYQIPISMDPYRYQYRLFWNIPIPIPIPGIGIGIGISAYTRYRSISTCQTRKAWADSFPLPSRGATTLRGPSNFNSQVGFPWLAKSTKFRPTGVPRHVGMLQYFACLSSSTLLYLKIRTRFHLPSYLLYLNLSCGENISKVGQTNKLIFALILFCVTTVGGDLHVYILDQNVYDMFLFDISIRT